VRGKSVLEIGCGDGVTSVELAYCGARVTGIDISPASIDVARQRARLQGFDVEFLVGNVVETESLGEEAYDVVVCDAVLHHLVDSLDVVMRKINGALKPGGLFVAREPVAYARWLKGLRGLVPLKTDVTPDERPFAAPEFATVRRHFPGLRLKHYRLLGRVDRVTNRLGVIRAASRVDGLLFRIPGTKALAGNVVMWSEK
jgi:SAM-dependent methyltransferase